MQYLLQFFPPALTACSSDKNEIIVSRDVDYIGAAPAGMQTQDVDNLLMPVPVMITKNGVQQNVTKVTATTKNSDIIELRGAFEGTTNTFTVYGKQEGNATINIDAETDSGIKMSTSVNVTVKSFAQCGYIRFTNWTNFVKMATIPSGLFPVDQSNLPVNAKTPQEISEFLMKDYVSLGMLTEGTYLSMYNQLVESVGSSKPEDIEAKYKFIGGQLYWRTTDTTHEHMFGLEAHNVKTDLDVSWANYGELTENGFERDTTWTEGNVSEIITCYSTTGPQKMSKCNYESWTTQPTDRTKCWEIQFKNDDKSAEGKGYFYLFIPFIDFEQTKGGPDKIVTE